MKWATAFATLLVVLLALALALGVPWAFRSGSASSSSSLACAVTDTACGGDEVEVFRMSDTSNAHAAAQGDATYTYRVCCGSVAALGLGTNCSGTYDTVLTLSAVGNAHVGSLGQYPTEVCLSADSVNVVDCMFVGSCSGSQACLATASGTDNAHVADCDGLDDYATKVCCYAGADMPVGGTAQLPDVSGSSGRNYIALAGLAAGALVALTAGAWYVRKRRWLG